MSTPADFDPYTPFDAQLDAAPDTVVGVTDSSTKATSAAQTPPQSAGASGAKAQWRAFSKRSLSPVLRRERQLSQAMQLAMAAVGGALLVVLTSTVMGVVIPRPDKPTVANNQHPLVTVEDLTANALTRNQATTTGDGNALNADSSTVSAGNAGTMPAAPLDSDSVDSATDTASTDEGSEGGTGSGSLTSLVSSPKRERKRARREQDRILDEQRQLEDRKRALDRQIEDKQGEERRRQEDQTIAEARIAEDQKRLDDRHSEDDRLSAEAKQREGQHTDDPKFAQVP